MKWSKSDCTHFPKVLITVHSFVFNLEYIIVFFKRLIIPHALQILKTC